MSSTKISSREKSYYTTIPNVVTEMFTSGIINKNTFTFYILCRRIAGESGVCFKGRETFTKQMKCSSREIQLAKEELSKPRDFLNGKSLIIWEKQESGSQDADHIMIEDIWLENMTIYHDKTTRQKFPTLFPGEHPPVPIGTPPCSQGNTKKEPIKKEPIKKDDDDPQAELDNQNIKKMIVFKHATKNIVTREESKIYEYLRSEGCTDQEIQREITKANIAEPILKSDTANVIERYLLVSIQNERIKQHKENKKNEYREYSGKTRSSNRQQDSIQRSREWLEQATDSHECNTKP